MGEIRSRERTCVTEYPLQVNNHNLFFLRIAVINTDGCRNNKRLTFSDTKSHCANVTRFANATLRHYSESSEHSRNSLCRRSTGFLHILKILINVFDSYSSGGPTETRESPEDSLYSLSNKRLSHNAFSNKPSTSGGSSNTGARVQRMLSKLAMVYSDWDFQHTFCSHLKF